jgi:hypothetical protein
MAIDGELDKIGLLLRTLAQFIVNYFELILRMKPNRVHPTRDFDLRIRNWKPNSFDLFLGKDEDILPVLERPGSLLQRDQPLAITPDARGEGECFVRFVRGEELIGEALQRGAPHNVQKLFRRINRCTLFKMLWTGEPFCQAVSFLMKARTKHPTIDALGEGQRAWDFAGEPSLAPSRVCHRALELSDGYTRHCKTIACGPACALRLGWFSTSFRSALFNV